MRRKVAALLLIALFLAPGVCQAASQEDFQVKTTRNLVNLCTASPQDPLHREAIHFCEGYLVGAYSYYHTASTGNNMLRIVCLPDPPPSRDSAISMFVKWVQAHPQYMDEKPVETFFRFLGETWPCKK